MSVSTESALQRLVRLADRHLTDPLDRAEVERVEAELLDEIRGGDMDALAEVLGLAGTILAVLSLIYAKDETGLDEPPPEAARAALAALEGRLRDAATRVRYDA